MRRPSRSPNPPHPLQSWAALLVEAWRGAADQDALCRRLAISSLELGRRLRQLRAAGLARRVTLFDPVRSGRALECLVLVRLGDYGASGLAALEAELRGDRHVLAADAVTGVFDYQIYCAFSDARAADAWLRGLREAHRPAAVDFRHVRTLSGSSVDGVACRFAPP